MFSKIITSCFLISFLFHYSDGVYIVRTANMAVSLHQECTCLELRCCAESVGRLEGSICRVSKNTGMNPPSAEMKPIRALVIKLCHPGDDSISTQASTPLFNDKYPADISFFPGLAAPSSEVETFDLLDLKTSVFRPPPV